MAQTIKLKRSATPSAIPSTASLSLGEVAINTYDGKMFIKKDDGTEAIVEIGSGGGGVSSFADNAKLTFGNSADLEIFHDGSNSYIVDTGTGDLKIQGANVRLENPSGVRYFQGSSGVSYLYNSGDIKLNTTATGIDVTGNITVSGTVDGRDVAADGTKLDGIESGATADQTAAEILTAIKTVDGASSGLDADLLDGQQGTYYYPASNPNGYTTNVGDITGVTAGVGLSGGGTSGTVTLTVDLSELTDMTAAMVGTDEFIVLDASADHRKAANEIGLSIFNNDAGYTTNVGDITGVTAGTYLTGGGTSGTVTLNVDATTTNTASKVVARDASGDFSAGLVTVTSANIDGHVLQDSADRSGLLGISTALGTWKGIQIIASGTALWSVMGDQDDFGFYDDINNDWILRYNENSTLELYANGSNTVDVTTSGLTVTGNISVTGTVDGRDVAADGTKLDGIESGATADQTQSDINALAITQVGTITSGTWQGTAIASAYLDSDTAHLSGAQTFTGVKTFASPVINTGVSGTAILDEDTMVSNSATKLATQQSIKAYVDTEVAGVVDSAPAALDTLNELAAALGDDANFSTTTSTALGNRLRVDTAAQGLTGTQQANAITNLGITATKAELNYVDGVTSNIQTQLDGKQATGSYLTGNQTITLSGDVSGSGTTSIAVTIADDSHNHVISNVDGLQTALDAKLASSSYTAADVLTKIKTVDGAGSGLDADTLDGISSASFLRSDASDTFTTLSGTTINLGSQVSLSESSHRADLLAITSTTSSYGGITIGNSSGETLTSFMGQGNAFGIYDDQNNEWALLCTENSEVRIYHNGSEKFATTSSGVAIIGNISVTGTVDGRDIAADGALIDSAVQNLSDLSITATAAEINKLDGVTATTAELNYIDGVTSNIQTQLDAKASTGKAIAMAMIFGG